MGVDEIPVTAFAAAIPKAIFLQITDQFPDLWWHCERPCSIPYCHDYYVSWMSSGETDVARTLCGVFRVPPPVFRKILPRVSAAYSEHGTRVAEHARAKRGQLSPLHMQTYAEGAGYLQDGIEAWGALS